jgi:four helix bundle protein
MPPPGTLRAFDAAEDFAVDVTRWLESLKKPCPHADQLRRAADSIGSNLNEGFGRGPGLDRKRFYRTATSSCEEALGWLRKSRRMRQIEPKKFHRFTNRGVVIIRMIKRLRN